jgi:hypothetical protein
MTAQRTPALGGERTVALGGERTVPTPDPIARDYLMLALRIGQRIDGLIDGYFGPADLKAQVDTEQLPQPERLVADAVALRERVEDEVPEADRRDWLVRQLVALEAHARSLGGERMPYREELERLFDWVPARRDDAQFEEAAARLDALLPGADPLVERLATWDAGLVVPEPALSDVVAWLVARFREQARATLGLPDGESFRTAFVRNRPWSGYNWYEGGFRSRFDLNLDLPVRAPALIHVVAHETYPGHHLEHAWKEADLVERQHRLEASVLLINAPECLISEGLADLGHRFAVPPADEPALLAELLERAAVPALAGDGAAAIADRALRLAAARSVLDEIAINAALMRHADGVDHDAVLEYLVSVGRMDPARAAKRLEFIEHPLWRSYVFVYDEGEALLGRWVDAVPEPERPARFGRLLHEQLTPSAIAAEIATRPSAAAPEADRTVTGTVSVPSTTPSASRS